MNIYNRFEFQIAVAIELILQLMDNGESFVTLMDYLDDIVIIKNADKTSQSIIFYQVKSKSKGSITIKTVLKEGWLDKMYYNIEALFQYKNKAVLITNTGISFDAKSNVEDLDVVSLDEYLDESNNSNLKNEIVKQIAVNNHIEADKVFFNKFYIQKTKLILDDYDTQLKGEFHDMASKHYPNLTVISIDAIFNKIKIELAIRQKNKFNSTIPSIEKLYARKGFSSKELNNIISLVNDVQFPDNFDLYKIYETLVSSNIKKNYVIFGNELEEFKIDTIKSSNSTLELCFSILDESKLIYEINNEEFIEKLGNYLLSNEKVNIKNYVIKYNEYIITLYAFKRLNGGER